MTYEPTQEQLLHTLRLCGVNSFLPAEPYYGQTITAAEFNPETARLLLAFEDGRRIEIWDNGQSCCESRYAMTDDDVSTLVGNKLTLVQVKEGPDLDDNGEYHEQTFVEVATDKGFITLVSHNEHNGYYGGFNITITDPDAS